jgi:probable phosphoglycerate mutase
LKALYYIRHGQTADIVSGIKSRPNTPLTTEGIGQAARAGESLASRGIHPSLIVCSEFLRARQSALAVAQVVGYNLEIKVEPLLNERHYGEAEGLPLAELEQRWPGGIDLAPNIEPIEVLQRRAAAAVEWFTKLTPDIVVVVGHGTLGRAIIRAVTGTPYTDEYRPGRFALETGQVISLFPQVTTEF